jgi:hypothetical protein
MVTGEWAMGNFVTHSLIFIRQLTDQIAETKFSVANCQIVSLTQIQVVLHDNNSPMDRGRLGQAV